MKKYLCTMAAGAAWRSVYQITGPRLESFAGRHGYTMATTTTRLSTRSPAVWDKLKAIDDLFRLDADVVLWVDADVLIKNLDRDVELPNWASHALCLHTWPECGVWKMRRDFRPVLRQAWGMYDELTARGVPFGDQGAIAELLGYSLAKGSPPHVAATRSTPLCDRTHYLDPRFNVLRRQVARHADAWFLHAAGGDRADKRDFLKRFAK